MVFANLRIASVACLIVCGVSVFVAVERYQTNAKTVATWNELGRTFPVGGSHREMVPATPAATKYALFLALISGVGGIVLFTRSRRPE